MHITVEDYLDVVLCESMPYNKFYRVPVPQWFTMTSMQYQVNVCSWINNFFMEISLQSSGYMLFYFLIDFNMFNLKY